MRLLQGADPEHGGFGGAPKFPTPTSLAMLLAAVDALPEPKAREALEHVVLTCKEMARGGVYDQLGGGFHRYSVDAHWGVPHFEKMLYDQGQLLSIYAEAWRRCGGAWRPDTGCSCTCIPTRRPRPGSGSKPSPARTRPWWCRGSG